MNLKDFIALKFFSIMFMYLDSFVHDFNLINMENKILIFAWQNIKLQGDSKWIQHIPI